MFHIIYETTCKITGKYYLGMHSTENLEDGYLGSGKILKRSIRKYGKNAHTRKILEMLPSREALALRETKIITPELLKDPMCMNIGKGGEGHHPGYINTLESRKKNSEGTKRMWARLRSQGYVPPPQSAETIAKRVAKITGKKRTMQQKQKAKDAQYEAQKRLANDPQYKVNFSAKVKAGLANMSPEAKELMKQRQSEAAIADRQKHTPERLLSYEKMAATRRGKKYPKRDPRTTVPKISKKRPTRTWVIEKENGEKFEVKNLKQFCISENISHSRIYKTLISGKFISGYRVVSILNKPKYGTKIKVKRIKKSKIWTIEKINGEIFEVENLKKFCIDNNMTMCSMQRSEKNGKFKNGFRVLSKRLDFYEQKLSVWKNNLHKFKDILLSIPASTLSCEGQEI